MIELKEHNIEPYSRLCAALEENDKVGYESATGTGKSYVGGKYVEEHGLKDKTLILVPSNVIRDGWQKILPGVDTMTYQALQNSEIGCENYSLIICDEMHHLGAEIWGRTFSEKTAGYMGKLLGMSATPIRFLDNKRNMIEEMFEGNRVIGIDLPEAIEKNVLPSFDYIAVLYNLASMRPKDTGRNSELTEKLYKQLDVMENEHSFQNIIRKHMKPGDHKVAVFVPSIGQIQEYKTVVETVYPDALHLVAHSKMRKSEIEQTFDAFENTKGTCFIYTVDLLNEGAHIDGVDTVIMFRKTESPTVFLQQLGRALTTNSAGDRITVFDFVANHANIHAKGDGAGNVIDWINDEIKNPKRQVIKVDYAKTEMELLNKIEDLVSTRWLESEDEIIREHYDEGRGIDEVMRRLPDRTRYSIQSRARTLNLTRDKADNWTAEEDALVIECYMHGKDINELMRLLPNRSRQAIFGRAKVLKLTKAVCDHKRNGVYDDIRNLYPLENGLREIKKKYPDLTTRQIYAIATKIGVKGYNAHLAWTEAEDQILLDHLGESAGELAYLLPNRNVSAIAARQRKQGLSSNKMVRWTEGEDEIILAHKNLSPKEISQDYLPARSSAAIRKRAVELGVRFPVKSYRMNDAEKELFIDLYSEGGPDAVLSHEAFSSFTRSSIYTRAYKLGVGYREKKVMANA